MLYEEIEDRLTALLGCEDSLVLPTITHIHMSVIPLLAASGTIFLDARAHKTIYDGCQVARSRGAAVRRFRFEDPDHLDELLRGEADRTRLVCMDGVNSMTGNAPDLQAFADVARRHGALLYVDDAHGFGVIGERSPHEPSPYGLRGNSVVRYAGESYDGLVLVGGFSKAYSSLLAFIACPTEVKQPAEGRRAAVPVLRPVAGRVAGHGARRASTSTSAAATRCAPTLHALTARVLDALDRLDIETPNRSGLPIIEIPLRHHDRIDDVGRFLFDRGIYVTLAAYPLVPKDEVGFRVQLTAANTTDEVDRLIAALEELVERGELRSAARRRRGRRHDRGAHARCASPPWAAYLAVGAVACALYVACPAAQGQRPADEPDRALAGGGDPRRRPSCTGPPSSAAVVSCSPPARRCSGSATSTPTAIRTCSARRCRSRRPATRSTSRCTR